MAKQRNIKRYGWTPDLPDNRDKVFEYMKLGHLPDFVDLRDKCPPVVDQLELGSCVGNSIASAFRFEQMRQKAPDWQPSRLMIYYNARDLEGTEDYDSGSQIRDGIKSIADQGVCPETDWPYDITKFAERPPPSAYTTGLNNQAISYRRVGFSLHSMIACLALGLPFVFGFSVYQSFESDKVASTGVVPMPTDKESVVGGHAVLCVGLDRAKETFLIMNSWGTSWGMDGYFTMPLDYLTNPNLCDDRWVVSKVEG